MPPVYKQTPWNIYLPDLSGRFDLKIYIRKYLKKHIKTWYSSKCPNTSYTTNYHHWTKIFQFLLLNNIYWEY